MEYRNMRPVIKNNMFLFTDSCNMSFYYTSAILMSILNFDISFFSCFRLLQIQTWTEDETEAKARDVIVENNGEPSALVQSFVPYTRNFARVLVFNGAHDGPPSNSEQFTMPEGSKTTRALDLC